MNYIYIIFNPKFSKYSLVSVTNESPIKINTELNTKYANQQIDNDFYRLIYVKEIDGDITNLSNKINLLFKDYKRPESKFFSIKANLAIELLENKFFRKEISDRALNDWWISLNNSWKYIFEKKIFPQTHANDEGSNLHKITS